MLALYQLDALKGEDVASIRASLDDLESLTDEGLTFADAGREFSEKDRDRAVAIAQGAWSERASADAAFAELAPEWPAHRMPAVDRAVLRLAHYEMHAGSAAPKAVVNEAVELAKQFSTADSPGFVNALLDKILKRVLASQPAGGPDDASEESTETA